VIDVLNNKNPYKLNIQINIMSNILTLGEDGNYCLIRPDESKIKNYISKSISSSVFESENYWSGLLNLLKIEDKGHASKFTPFGIAHDITVKNEKNITSLVNNFFEEAEKYRMNRADFVLVQDLSLKNLNSFLKNPSFSGKAQLLLHQ
jgi:hypothetical protein